MAVESDSDRAVFFNPDEFGQQARFTPSGGGSAVDVTIIPSRGRQDSALGELGTVSPRSIVLLRVSEVAAPRGGTLEISAVVFNIIKAELEEEGAIWRLQLRPT